MSRTALHPRLVLGFFADLVIGYVTDLVVDFVTDLVIGLVTDHVKVTQYTSPKNQQAQYQKLSKRTFA